jgi:beta-lactamase regulating signal transducer with metallopeptidase domain
MFKCVIFFNPFLPRCWHLKVKNRKEKREDNILLVLFIIIFIIFLAYFLTSFLRYIMISKELRELKRAYEAEKEQIADKERTLQKLKDLVEATDTTNNKEVGKTQNGQ